MEEGYMASETRYMWSLSSLVCAYLDLAIAFFFLSASTIGFLGVKFLGFCGLRLPYPCKGLFGISPNDISNFQRFLIDFASEKVANVKLSVKERCIFNDPLNLRLVEMEGEASSVRMSINRREGSVDENVFSDDYDQQFESDSSTSEELNGHAQLDRFLDVDDKRAIRLLEEALEKEKTARAALYIDLEKERSAAATAAEVAMAMILRLQEEKSSIEMEARQYERIIEEKSAYEADEMAILKEILVRRETEKLFLEKEVEAYREMIYLENEHFSCNHDHISDTESSGEDPVYDDKKSKDDNGDDEWHGERLKSVQEGSEKFIISVESGCQEEAAQLKLLEDIACQLQEIRHLTINEG